MDELPLQNIRLNDPFWSPRLEVNASRAIFHQWRQLEASGCIDNFRIAAGEKVGLRQGWFFADSDAYKWLEAAARVVKAEPPLSVIGGSEAAPNNTQNKLAALMDDFIGLLGRAQQADGYLFTYNQVHFPGTRWVNLQIEHELYCHGHLIEAGVSHFQATGRTDLLAIARWAADRIVADFMEAGPDRTSGHEEVEIALLRLHQVSGQAVYLEMARRFLERRGRSPHFALSLLGQNFSAGARGKKVLQERAAYRAAHPEQAEFKLPEGNFAKKPFAVDLRWNLNALSGRYFQQHAPIRRQDTAEGHSVRFGYLETALAMLYRTRPDPGLLPALEAAWQNMVTRRMYVTGGIGSLPALEGFGTDYELDPEYAYAETCAALAGMFWNWEMALISGQAKYSDLFEWQLYNAAGVGMSLSGENYLYNNPLASRGGVTRKAWYAVPCCPSNLSRTWAGLGKYTYSTAAGALWIHQYIGSQVTFSHGPCAGLAIRSGLPWEGKVQVALELDTPAEFSLYLRLPSWAGQSRVTVNGQPIPIGPLPIEEAEPTASGYDPRRACFLPIRREWHPGDCLELDFELPIRLRRAHPKVRGHAGKAAVSRGPLVYCLESVDNPGVDIFTCRLEPASLQVESAPDLLNGCQVLRGRTVEGQHLVLIPYALWGNRGESQMTVWIRTT